MDAPLYTTNDWHLASFLRTHGMPLAGCRRLGPKKVEFRFPAGRELHAMLRLYWSGRVVPTVPARLFESLRVLKSLSIERFPKAGR